MRRRTFQQDGYCQWAPQDNKLDVQGTRSPRCLGISPSTSVPQNSWAFLEFLGYEFHRTSQDGCFVQGRAVKNLKERRPVMNGSSAFEGRTASARLLVYVFKGRGKCTSRVLNPDRSLPQGHSGSTAGRRETSRRQRRPAP